MASNYPTSRPVKRIHAPLGGFCVEIDNRSSWSGKRWLVRIVNDEGRQTQPYAKIFYSHSDAVAYARKCLEV